MILVLMPINPQQEGQLTYFGFGKTTIDQIDYGIFRFRKNYILSLKLF
jgi:hypothetical protein